MAGSERLGRFELRGLLGRGGSGEVYAARSSGRSVALKVLRADVVPNEAERRRFLEEARRLAAVRHPNVIRVIDAGELDDGRPFLAMELLEGEPLVSRLALGPLPPGEALRLFSQVAGATAALHECSIIHRDLKPENVFLVHDAAGRPPRAVLLDFGIATEEGASGTLTRQGWVRGTPDYMAPERFFGAPASRASDVYELALLLYVMLAGRLPWADGSDPEGRLDPAKPSALGAAVPAALDSAILRALSTRVERRPASAEAFLRAVMSSAGQEAAPARRTGRSAPAVSSSGGPDLPRRWAPGHRRPLGWAAFALASAAAVGLFALVADCEGLHPMPATAIREGAPGWRHHSSDPDLLVGVDLVKLRGFPPIGKVLSVFDRADNPLVAVRERCGLNPLGALHHLELAVYADGERRSTELGASGPWQRVTFERCLFDLLGELGIESTVRQEGAHSRYLIAGEPLLIGWSGDRTLFATDRTEVEPAWMDQRLESREPVRVSPVLERALSEIEPSAAAWLVTREWAGDDEPIPEAVYFYLVLEESIEAEFGAFFSNEREAERAAREARSELEEIRRDQSAWELVERDRVATRGNIAFVRVEIGERGLEALLDEIEELERDIRRRLTK